MGSIEENSLKWTEKVLLKTVDLDAGLNANVIYEILDGDLADRFAIESNVIVLKNNQTLDFEEIYMLKEQDKLNKVKFAGDESLLENDEIELHLIVKAKDFGEPQLSSTALVKIIVKVILYQIIDAFLFSFIFKKGY